MSASNIERVDLANLELVSKHDTYDVYVCPFCEEGKQPKLYWYHDSNQGWCFRCSILYFEKGIDYDIYNEETGEYRFPLLCEGYRRSILTKKVIEEKDGAIKTVPFFFPKIERGSEAYKYLKKRNPFIPHLLPLLDLREWSGKEVGICSPFWYQEKVSTYQVRWLEPGEKSKYWTYPSNKLLYSPIRVFKSIEWKEQPIVTLAEGVYDSIALLCMGYSCPVAVLGKTLTSLQIRMLRALLPSKVYLCFDKWEISAKVKENLKKLVPSLERVEIKNPWEKTNTGDPEEYMMKCLKYTPAIATIILERIMKIMEVENDRS